MFLLCSCCLRLPGTHVRYPGLTRVRHKDGWPDPYPPRRGGRGVSEWLSINSPVPPTWNHTAAALAPLLKTAHCVESSCGEMTALQMERESEAGGCWLQTVWEKCQTKRNIWIPEARDECPCPAGIIDQSNIHESLYQPELCKIQKNSESASI